MIHLPNNTLTLLVNTEYLYKNNCTMKTVSPIPGYTDETWEYIIKQAPHLTRFPTDQPFNFTWVDRVLGKGKVATKN